MIAFLQTVTDLLYATLILVITLYIFFMYRADSTPPSLLLSGFSSPKKLSSLLDSQIAASRSELVRLEETKKLQVLN